MKTISPSIYSKDYFSRYQDQSLENPSKISKKNQEILSYIQKNKPNKILDFGCGAGLLCILISKHLGIPVYGIDYSKDAILIARHNLKKYKKQIKGKLPIFVHSDNQHLPKKLDTVDLIIMADVIEHLYDWEIKSIFNYFKKYYPNAKILIHTDNNLYLKTTQKLINILSTLVDPSKKTEISKRREEDAKMHINLTTEQALTSKLSRYGFAKVASFYPTFDAQSIHTQLGGLSKLFFLTKLSTVILGIQISLIKKFFMPSFYAIYQKSK